MTKTQLDSDITFWTGVGTGSYSTADRTANENNHYHRIISMILNAQDDWDFDDSNYTDYPIATTPLVANQRDYIFPTSLKMMKIKRVDVTYDGSTYNRANPVDSQEFGFGLGNDTTVDGNFSKSEPFYDVKANAIWIYPLASASDVTAGAKIRIEFYREIDEFVVGDTTQEPGFDEPFHRMISIGASLDWAIKTNNDEKIKTLSALLGDYEQRLKTYYGTKTKDRTYILKPALTNYE